MPGTNKPKREGKEGPRLGGHSGRQSGSSMEERNLKRGMDPRSAQYALLFRMKCRMRSVVGM